jgi:hypothetical protein
MKMKTVFKVWNVLMIIAAVINIIGAVSKIATSGDGAESAYTTLSALFSLVPVIFSLIMARAGFKEEYSTATKLGLVILTVDIISVFTVGGSAVLSLLLACAYVYMSISLNKCRY